MAASSSYPVLFAQKPWYTITLEGLDRYSILHFPIKASKVKEEHKVQTISLKVSVVQKDKIETERCSQKCSQNVRAVSVDREGLLEPDQIRFQVNCTSYNHGYLSIQFKLVDCTKDVVQIWTTRFYEIIATRTKSSIGVFPIRGDQVLAPQLPLPVSENVSTCMEIVPPVAEPVPESVIEPRQKLWNDSVLWGNTEATLRNLVYWANNNNNPQAMPNKLWSDVVEVANSEQKIYISQVKPYDLAVTLAAHTAALFLGKRDESNKMRKYIYCVICGQQGTQEHLEEIHARSQLQHLFEDFQHTYPVANLLDLFKATILKISLRGLWTEYHCIFCGQNPPNHKKHLIEDLVKKLHKYPTNAYEGAMDKFPGWNPMMFHAWMPDTPGTIPPELQGWLEYLFVGDFAKWTGAQENQQK